VRAQINPGEVSASFPAAPPKTPRNAVGADTTTAAAERQMTAIDVEIE